MTLTTSSTQTGHRPGPPDDPSSAPSEPTPPRTGWFALAGLAAGGLGLAVDQLLAALIGPVGAAVTAVSGAILRLLPAGMINFGKDVLGHADKPVLNTLVLLGALALAVLAGILAGRRLFAGLLVLTGLSAVALTAAASAADFSGAAVVPLLAGWLVSLIALRGLVRLAAPDHLFPHPENAGLDRRRFLTASGVVGGVAIVGGVGSQSLSKAVAGAPGARTLTLPPPTVSAPAVPRGADFHVRGLAPYITPDTDFYRVDTAFIVPRLTVPDWKLSIKGLVDHPFELTMDQVLSRPLEEHYVTLACVSNPVGGDLVGNAKWLGLRLNTLLAEAGPQAGADMVLSVSSDGFSAGTPLDIMTDPDRACLLAIGMNGKQLPAQHGFPARLVVPGLYGYVSATKWVVELNVTTFADAEGYWTPLGWSARGPVKLASRIDTPSSVAKAGTVPVAGVAWCQHTGISRVQLRIDTDDFVDAELAPVTGKDTWRQWRYDWNATPGKHTLAVRATDADGHVQVEKVAPEAPNGATGLHTVSIDVR